jgi:hypothetical protein
MLDGLSGHSSVVDGEIETRRRMPIIKLILHRSHELKASGILFQRQVEDAGNMLLRNDQTVAPRQRVFVGNGQSELVFRQNIFLRLAEWAVRHGAYVTTRECDGSRMVTLVQVLSFKLNA